MRISLPLMFIMLLHFGVSAQKKERFVIAGHIQGLADGTMIRLLDLDEQSILDSAKSLNGTFTLTGRVLDPTGCRLFAANELVTFIMVENVNMTFESGLKDEQLFIKTTGGKEQDLQNIFDSILAPYSDVASKTSVTLDNKIYANETERLALVNKINNANNAYQHAYVDFGKKHPNSFVGLDVLYRNRLTIPRDTLQIIFNKITAPVLSSTKASSLKSFLNAPLLKTGDKMTDFDAKTIKGENFKLSQLKGKFIYLAFGSVGCGPCRLENQEIKKNYAQLSKEIEFIYFSLDKDISAWTDISKKDGIIWHNISDLEGGIGRIKTLYGVQAMPTSFLINKDGIIIKKFVGYDPQLITVLKDLTAQTK